MKVKFDTEKYENDPEYRAKIDARREHVREYQREYQRKHNAEIQARKKEQKNGSETEVKKEQSVTHVQDAFRRIVCLGCAPGHACVMYLPTDAGTGDFAQIFCPCDGKQVTGVCTMEERK